MLNCFISGFFTVLSRPVLADLSFYVICQQARTAICTRSNCYL
ncbi:unnamed protein product [Linum tenue]|uniref:Uncharacterized protein n=1 Tax=Linum tenue TaxID=586396 RepID=A0AAV0RA07_9ROSI|nr:unnamed protein product [Linum tenue]